MRRHDETKTKTTTTTAMTMTTTTILFFHCELECFAEDNYASGIYTQHPLPRSMSMLSTNKEAHTASATAEHLASSLISP